MQISMPFSRRFLFAAAFAAVACLAAALPADAHSYKKGDLTIGHPWSRVTVSTSRPAVGYLTVTNNGTTPDRLVAAESPVAGRVQLHLSSMKDGVMKMEHVDGIEIPAGATVELAPGGYHLMLMNPKIVFEEGARLPLTLAFEKAGKVEVELKVEPISGSKKDHGDGMNHGEGHMQGGGHHHH